MQPQKWELECPGCGAIFAEAHDSCPRCGQDLQDVFAGTYTPGATPGRRVLSIVLLAVIAVGLIAGLALMFSGCVRTG